MLSAAFTGLVREELLGDAWADKDIRERNRGKREEITESIKRERERERESKKE